MRHGGDFFNKSINKISGPVSMYYLKPNYEIIKDNHINLPLFLLFGDFHFSYDNMCSECTCEKTSKTCCSKIYSGDFIKTINNLSTPTRPIDFYTEYFDDNDDGGFDGPLDKFREPEFQPCYKKDIKTHTQCPAKNIRWQYSDIRLSKLKNNIEYIFDSIYVFTEFCEKLNDNNKFEGLSIDTWSKISNCIHNKNSKFDKETIDRFIEEKPAFANKLENIDFFITAFYTKHSGIDVVKTEHMRKIINMLSEFLFTHNQDIDKLASDIVDLLLSYNTSAYQSLIFKQFVKQDNNSIFGTKNFLIDSFKNSLHNRLVGFDYSKIDKKTLDNLFKFELFGENYAEINTLLLHINSIFLDIYTILRIMKKIEDPPSLCIGYFGNAHTKSIVDILMTSGYYKKDFFIDEQKQNRCLTFNIDDINLLSDLKRHNKRMNLRMNLLTNPSKSQKKKSKSQKKKSKSQKKKDTRSGA